jgi:ABC-type antimicrobial peptide transport system permease subunit
VIPREIRLVGDPEGASGATATVVRVVSGAYFATVGSLLKGLLFGVEPIDPLTIVFAAALLVAVALAASAIPARRATAVDPMTVLRSE